MLQKLRDLFRNDRGQDLIEYTLLLAFVCLVVAGVFVNASGGIGAVWTAGNNTLAAGADAVSGSASGSGSPAPPPTSPPANGGQQPGGDGDGHHDDHHHDYR